MPPPDDREIDGTEASRITEDGAYRVSENGDFMVPEDFGGVRITEDGANRISEDGAVRVSEDFGGVLNAVAPGAVLVATATLLPGGATGVIEIAVSFGHGAPPLYRRDGHAPGAILVARARLLPGSASAQSLPPAITTRDGVAPGALMTRSIRLVAGSATGEVTLSDDELFLLLEAA